MKKQLILLFTVLASFSLMADEKADMAIFESANKIYEEANYKEAAEIYNRLLDRDYISDDLHYNLANAYFKTNDIAFAVLHYERALKINPNNEDATHNLALANEKTVDKIEAIPVIFFYQWWESIVNLLGIDPWAKTAVGFFFLAFIGFSIYLTNRTLVLKKTAFYVFTFSLGLGLVGWFMATHQNGSLSAQKYAIVMNPTVNINSSPSEGSSQLFVLHEGSKVRIKEETEVWFRISLPNGNEGWVEKSEVEGV